jgi:hypothetical protein
MEIDIAITAKLPRAQAEALLKDLRAQYAVLFNEHWYRCWWPSPRWLHEKA